MRPPKSSVLLVDDDPAARRLLHHVLGEYDFFEVAGEAANGEQAIQEAGRLQPDVVLLDLMMPVMDGLAALPEIVRAAPRSRVVVLSMLRQQRMAERCLAEGAAAFIDKALPDREILQRLAQVVGIRTLPRNQASSAL